jgi:hypothetical protein
VAVRCAVPIAVLPDSTALHRLLYSAHCSVAVRCAVPIAVLPDSTALHRLLYSAHCSVTVRCAVPIAVTGQLSTTQTAVQWVPVVIRPELGVDHPPPSSAEVEEQ